MNKKQKFSKVLCEEDRYSNVWIFYPTGGNYIHDELLRMPGGSIVKNEKAQKVLDLMNS